MSDDLKAMSAETLVREYGQLQFHLGRIGELYGGQLFVKARRHGDELLRRLDLGERAMLALESLTPGGSEFVGDPDECVKFVRRSREQQFEAIKHLAKQAKANDGAVR